MIHYSKKEDIAPVDSGKLSKVFAGNSIVEIITTERHHGRINNYKRLKRGKYLNLETGEIKDTTKISVSRVDKLHSLSKSYTNLRRLIDYNFQCIPSEKHIVLTYKKNVLDYSIVCRDFKYFWSRFSYKYPRIDYVRVIEPHASGKWHIHLLVKNQTRQPLFIPVDTLTEIWGLGEARIFSLPKVTNYGLYFSANSPSDNSSSVESTDSVNDTKKSAIKNERLKYYPHNFRLYSCSRGISRPVPQVMTHEKALLIVRNKDPCFGYTKRIFQLDDSGDEIEVNAITYEQFEV